MKKQFQYNSLAALIAAADEMQEKISALVLAEQASSMELSEDAVFARMEKNYRVMKEGIKAGCAPELVSTSGLTGGEAAKMLRNIRSGKTITGPVFSGALMRSLAVAGLNASMGRIVAAPTAGSCGILPAAVITMEAEKGIPEHDCIMSLFTASAVGMVIANNATLAGAEGGCQAECGAASAMAAASLTELMGGTPEMIGDAAAIALKCVLGLVCDPVAGLVEIPCIKRNAGGVATAFAAAEMALAGIRSAIPADEVIVAMKKVGHIMSETLKETAEGGLAATPTGKHLKEQVFGTKG